MDHHKIKLIASQLCKNAFHAKAIYGIFFVMALLIGYAAYTGWKTYRVNNEIRDRYQRLDRESWENSPDKHPHRMAHFGAFAFRKKHPLSVFDFGLESFTGNAVFLEAHRQNTINFSEASLSTGLLRFGEISLAMLLQLILPLVIVFMGFHAVSADRENGTLKVLLTQGATWKDLIIGNSLGLLVLAFIFLIPVFLITLIALLSSEDALTFDLSIRYVGLVVFYALFTFVICVFTVTVSAASRSSRGSLLKLLGVWLLLAVVIPRTIQAVGSYIFPAPSKIEFETAIEQDVLKQGDSHNPDDPHYKHLKDSVLSAHHVDSVEKLPFNYSGFVMREGEKISATIYNQHLKKLTDIYDRQNGLTKVAAFINPFSAIRNASMALSGTDFESYKTFQKEAEQYRYLLAQRMNELQIELISNRKAPNDEPHEIDRAHWKALPAFKPKFIKAGSSFRFEAWSFAALVCWCLACAWVVTRISRSLKAI